MVRGNHDICERAGEGSFRFLDHEPMHPKCSAFVARAVGTHRSHPEKQDFWAILRLRDSERSFLPRLLPLLLKNHPTRRGLRTVYVKEVFRASDLIRIELFAGMLTADSEVWGARLSGLETALSKGTPQTQIGCLKVPGGHENAGAAAGRQGGGMSATRQPLWKLSFYH